MKVPKKMTLPIKELVIAIKGGGEMATGVATTLFQANFKHIFMMEIENPRAVRRRVSFCEAVHEGTATVEGVKAKKVVGIDGIRSAWESNCIPVLVDPDWNTIKVIHPHVVVDGIIAKKNLGTDSSQAPLVIGLGPGFEAGGDVHMVIETNRGHNLGRVILEGSPEPNTGIPGSIGGFTRERVLRAPCSGIFKSFLTLGASINKNDVIGHVDNQPVVAQINGILRGLIKNPARVKERLKIGDIDPRGNTEYCTTVSEKVRAVGGSVLQAILRKYNH
ncbi:MAG: EF2563 family selenium-dependent molybdenum hydroxylase system protein [Desulfobacteraceae bacterium]|nr:EF2563 family selenium-dependent molybdenum hydroxylase system protein [Desulfobacteraceae bacterium]